jgi:uncharacterized membrane protein
MKMMDKIWVGMMDVGARYGCHQRPERSFFVKDYQFPVCARCAGILTVKPIAWLVNHKTKVPFGVCILLLIPMGVDGLVQYWLKIESNNRRRFITGLLGGFAISTLRIRLIKKAAGKKPKKA